MVILIDPKKCQWLDSKHSVFVCPVKDPVKGWGQYNLPSAQ